jgi:3-oxoadipate enol-lactonase
MAGLSPTGVGWPCSTSAERVSQRPLRPPPRHSSSAPTWSPSGGPFSASTSALWAGPWGGMAALHAALDHPGTVTALVLLATTAGGTGLTWPTDEFLLFQVSGNGDRLDHERARAGLALVLSGTFRKCQEQLLDAFVEHARTQLVSDEIGAAQQNIFLTHDVATRLGEIAVPTVVICGTDDQAHPLPNSEFLTSGIPGARLVVVGGAGHLVHAEAPEQILDQALALFGA